MKNNLLAAFLTVTALVTVQGAAYSSPKAGEYYQQEAPNPPCSVNDPTGTPLNVRSKPNSNSKIIATLKNGTIVKQTNTPYRDGWAEIIFQVGKKKVTGWAFKNYLACG